MGLAASACVNPRADYDKFVEDTDPLRGRVATDSGAAPPPVELPPIVGAAPTTAISANYLLQCQPALSGGDPSKGLRFAAKLDYTPSTSGGSFGLTIRALLDPQHGGVSFSDLDPAGSDIVFPTTAVATDGRFASSLGDLAVPGNSNPISGLPIVVKESAVRGVFHDGDKLCMQLDGRLTQPVQVSINGTPCVASRVDDTTAPLPTYTPSEGAAFFVCPL